MNDDLPTIEQIIAKADSLGGKQLTPFDFCGRFENHEGPHSSTPDGLLHCWTEAEKGPRGGYEYLDSAIAAELGAGPRLTAAMVREARSYRGCTHVAYELGPCDECQAARLNAALAGAAPVEKSTSADKVKCESCGQDVTGPEFVRHRSVFCHKPQCRILHAHWVVEELRKLAQIWRVQSNGMSVLPRRIKRGCADNLDGLADKLEGDHALIGEAGQESS